MDLYDSGPMSQIMQIYLTKNLTGGEQYVQGPRKKLHMLSKKQRENMRQQQHMLMPAFIMTKSLEELSLHAYTL